MNIPLLEVPETRVLYMFSSNLEENPRLEIRKQLQSQIQRQETKAEEGNYGNPNQ